MIKVCILVAAYLLPTVWMTTPDTAHPFYVSVTEVAHDPKTKSLQVSHRIFIDDMELGLRETYNIVLKDPTNPGADIDPDALLKGYLEKHFQIMVEGKNLKPQYLGHEFEDDVVWCYVAYKGVNQIKNIRIRNHILLDTHDSQTNLVHVTYQDKTKSLKLDNRKKEGEIRF